MDRYVEWLRGVLRLAGEIYFQRVEAALWKFAEPFYAWMYDLFARPYTGWQESLDAFLAEQAAEGRTISPEIRQSIVDHIEAHFASTQYGSDLFPYLGRTGQHPSNAHLFYWLPPGSGFTDEDLVLAHHIALLTSQLRQAIRESTQTLEDPSFLENINPLADSPITQLRKIADMKAALSELELLYTLLGYDQITWNRFTRSRQSGLEGAEAHVPFAGPEHGIRRVTIETLMTAWGVASLAALGGKLVAKGFTRLAARASTSLPELRVLTRGIELHPGSMRRLILELDDEARKRLAPAIEKEMGLNLTRSRGVWDLGWGRRGQIIHERLGENLPAGFKTVDRFDEGIVTSIKSADLWGKKYVDPREIFRLGKKYIDDVAAFAGGKRAKIRIKATDIKGKAVNIVVPPRATPAQREALRQVETYGARKGIAVRITEIAE